MWVLFVKLLIISEDKLENLKYQDIEEWDSVGHMGLISCIEDIFNVTYRYRWHNRF